MNTKKNILFFGSLFVALFLFSCQDKKGYEHSENIPENIWQISDTLSFNATISDTENPYNIFLKIDVLENYLTDNLWLFVTSRSPSGNILNDTVKFFIFDQKGKPYGKKHGDKIKNKFLYKAHILFPEKGIYRFKIRHGMRIKDLPKVSSVGISIEKAK